MTGGDAESPPPSRLSSFAGISTVGATLSSSRRQTTQRCACTRASGSPGSVPRRYTAEADRPRLSRYGLTSRDMASPTKPFDVLVDGPSAERNPPPIVLKQVYEQR